MPKRHRIEPRPVSLVWVVLLSLFLPGLGHVWLGQRSKGAILFVGALFTCGLLGLLNVLSALDALWLARKLGRGESIGVWEGWGLLDKVAEFF